MRNFDKKIFNLPTFMFLWSQFLHIWQIHWVFCLYSTDPNNISYESPDTQLFGAVIMRAWHHHESAEPTSRKTVCYFSFWGRGGQEGWFFGIFFWLGQMSASNETNKHHNLVKSSSKGILISVQSISYRVWTPCMQRDERANSY